jgi:hypothetical protein
MVLWPAWPRSQWPCGTCQPWCCGPAAGDRDPRRRGIQWPPLRRSPPWKISPPPPASLEGDRSRLRGPYDRGQRGRPLPTSNHLKTPSRHLKECRCGHDLCLGFLVRHSDLTEGGERGGRPETEVVAERRGCAGGTTQRWGATSSPVDGLIPVVVAAPPIEVRVWGVGLISHRQP